MHQVPGHDRGVALGEIVVEADGPGVRRIAIGRPRPRLADPAAIGLRRDGVAEMLQRVEDAHGAMLHAVLVARDYCAADLAVIGALALVVEQARHAVEPLDEDAADGALLPEPNRRGDDENVGGLDLRP